ncbi:MAG: MaoC family dehydratase [Pseudomonadota bacterium]
MNSLTTRELNSPTPTLTLYRRALLRRKTSGEKTLPRLSLLMRGRRADPHQLELYNQACGFLTGREMPAVYPHILAFPLHMELMTSEGFPFPLLGLVHISNTITRHRPLTINEALDIHCRFGELEPHDKGTAFSVITEASVQGRTVWESSSTMLYRHPVPGGDRKEAATEDDLKGAASELWKVSSDMGRRYAAASGDRNPIHLWPITAKAFGFKRHIVHGMWTKAHAVARLAPQIGARPFTVAVGFKLPVFLPAEVSFIQKKDAAGIRFDVRDKDGVKPHLKGAVKFLD